MNAGILAAAALAGGVGAGLRYVLDRVIMRRRSGRFPLGILVVNVTGSLALGLLTGLGSAVIPAAWLTVLGTGLLGGYTTFSTVSVETVLLAQGRRRGAALNLVGTLVLAVAAAATGVGLGLMATGAV